MHWLARRNSKKKDQHKKGKQRDVSESEVENRESEREDQSDVESGDSVDSKQSLGYAKHPLEGFGSKRFPIVIDLTGDVSAQFIKTEIDSKSITIACD
jgi:hypothetical protein